MKSAHLTLHVHRFRCPNAACSRHTFVERLPTIARPYSHRTTRLAQQQQHLALALGGEAGSRMAERLHMATSPTTMIRLIRAFEPPPAPPPRHIGIDDWANRKGHTYGTIIIDLDTRRPIDLLPERTVEVVVTWLDAHPTVDVISRDRADVYRNGATQGAPHAQQVADRWHLMKNVGEALHRMLERHGPALRATAQQVADERAVHNPLPPPTESPPILPDLPIRHASIQRQEQFAEVKRLHAAGWSLRQIGLHLHLHRRTVKKYSEVDTVPVRILPQNISYAARYIPAIERLWASGCHTYMHIWRELQTMGFAGSYSSLRRLMKHLDPTDRRGEPSRSPTPLHSPVRTLSARQAMWLLVRRTDELKPEDVGTRTILCSLCPDAQVGHRLAQRFYGMIREREVDALDAWLLDAEASGVKELRNLALSLRSDYLAVRNAVQGIYSNGPVEAHVHRLKLIKRMMYGRANFDLLRKRVLAQI